MARILVTSALPYINGMKHLGTLAGSMLPADVYSRFQRARGHEVLYICATDEHGTPAELAALTEGRSVRDYCDHWHGEQKRVYDALGLSFDWFGRSSSPQNRDLTQAFAKTLWEAGFLEERVTRQAYSATDGRFLPDRYVIGTCPHCGYVRARGDQCENCTRVLDPADLIHPRSAVSGADDIEIRDSKHLFLRQTLFEPKLRAWIGDKQGDWPNLVTSIALKWLDEGLQDRGVTRDLEWGVAVNADQWGPNPDGALPDVAGLAGKVFYVWFDAPIEYIAATWERADALSQAGGPAGQAADWERWWRLPMASDVTYVQFMGKDNVPFHTVGFPCTLFGANEARSPAGEWWASSNAPWKLVDQLKGFNWLNYYGGKFSTSQHRGVFLDDAVELLPADTWRWYLSANAPEGSDSAFTWELFASAVNKDLADVLGNFVNRIAKFAETRFAGVVPEGGAPGELELRLHADLGARVGDLTAQLEAIEIRKSAQALRAIWVTGNEYLAEAAPWTAIKTDPVRAAVAVRTALNLAALFARLAHPFIPHAAQAIAEALGEELPGAWPTQDMDVELSRLAAGRSIRAPEVLFRKIDDAQIAEWTSRFGGSEAAPAES